MMKIKTGILLVSGFFLVTGLVLGAWQGGNVLAGSVQSKDPALRALEDKLDRILENQAAILTQLERIWKYK